MENYNKIIGDNLKNLRTARKLSLDKVSSLTGISKGMLSQIEKGTANPSISTIWKLAKGFKITFTELMNKAESDIELFKSSDIEPFVEDDGRYRNYPIIHFDPQRRFETYNIELDNGALLFAEPHPDKTQEYITVMQGELDITVSDNKYHLKKGDTLKFKADVSHSYENKSPELCVFYNILYYPE